MTIERWQDILDNIRDNLKVIEHKKEHIKEEGGVDIEYIIFQGPMGKIRLEFVIKPLILDKKVNYSNRIGSESSVDYIYSPDEKTNKFMAYKWDDDENDWVECSADSFK